MLGALSKFFPMQSTDQCLKAKKQIKKKPNKPTKNRKKKKIKQRQKSLMVQFFKSEEISVKNHSQNPKINDESSPCLSLNS